MSLRLVMVVLMGALMLAGCGRRGSLEPPPDADNVRAVPSPGRFPAREDEPEGEPFVLDPLL